VAAFVDEEGRCAVDALRSASSTSSATRAAPTPLRRSFAKRSTSSPSCSASRIKSSAFERVLVVEQEVVHLPERPLFGRRLGCLGGELRVDVDVGQRQVAPDVAEVCEVAQGQVFKLKATCPDGSRCGPYR
jgi:hypothetical protein